MFISLRDVRKTFVNRHAPAAPRTVFALDEFGLDRGGRVVLTGPSGCGKSTLLNILAGLLRPDAGAVRVADTDYATLRPAALDRFRGTRIGCVYQTFNLVPALTVHENLLLGLRLGRRVPRVQWNARVREMLDEVGLGHRRHSRPRQLSVGERQRVAIARALVNQPEVLLADEPTGSLDPATAAQMMALIDRVVAHGTHALVLVTHDPAIADRFENRFDCARLVRETS